MKGIQYIVLLSWLFHFLCSQSQADEIKHNDWEQRGLPSSPRQRTRRWWARQDRSAIGLEFFFGGVVSFFFVGLWLDLMRLAAYWVNKLISIIVLFEFDFINTAEGLFYSRLTVIISQSLMSILECSINFGIRRMDFRRRLDRRTNNNRTNL